MDRYPQIGIFFFI